jgi:hypothetical protein
MSHRHMSSAAHHHLRIMVEQMAAPRYVVMVSGGKLSPGSEEQIRRVLDSLKGKSNFHSVLVLPAKTVLCRYPEKVRTVAGKGGRHRGLRGKQESVVWVRAPMAGRAS